MAIGKENKKAWVSFFGTDEHLLEKEEDKKVSAAEESIHQTSEDTTKANQKDNVNTIDLTATQSKTFIKNSTESPIEDRVRQPSSELITEEVEANKLQPKKSGAKHIYDFGEILISEDTGRSQIKEIVIRTLKKVDSNNKLNEIDLERYEQQRKYFSYVQDFEYQNSDNEAQFGIIRFIYKQKPMIFAKSFVIHGGSDLEKINWKQNVTAYDAEDGDLSHDVTCDYHAVNPLKDGLYPVAYAVANRSGEIGRLIFWVRVKILPPNLTADDITMTASTMPNHRLLMAQVKASDVIDGELTNQVVVDDGQVVYERAGVYPIVYHIQNSFGLKSSVKKQLTIEAQEPDLNVKAMKLKATKNPGEIDWLDYASATDPIDGDISSQIAVDNHQVDLEHDGTYPIAYRVENKNGKVVTARTTVTVIVPRPTIEAMTFEIERGSDLTRIDWLSHVRALDEDGRNLTEHVTTFYEDINPNEPGEYPLYYLVRNAYQQQTMKRVTVAVK